jgi:hypothetical protein
VLLSARTLIGLAIGADWAIATAYIAEEPARVTCLAPAVDDHGQDPGLLHRRADHLHRVPRQRGQRQPSPTVRQ